MRQKLFRTRAPSALAGDGGVRLLSQLVCVEITATSTRERSRQLEDSTATGTPVDARASETTLRRARLMTTGARE